MKCLVFVLCLFWCGFSDAKVAFPDGFIKCPKDKTFSDCLAKAAPVDSTLLKDGYAAGGIPPMQPIDVGNVTLKIGNQKTGVYFNTFLDDVEVVFTLTNMSNVDIDFSTGKFQFDALFEKFTGNAKHNTTGRFLITNVAGHGRFETTFHDIVYTIQAKIDEVERDGAKHWNLDNLKLKMKTVRKVDVDIDLVPNKQVNDAIIKVINDNWKQLLRPVAATLEDLFGAKLQDHLNKFFSAVPVEDLVLTDSQ